MRKAIYEKKVAPPGVKPRFMTMEEGVKKMRKVSKCRDGSRYTNFMTTAFMTLKIVVRSGEVECYLKPGWFDMNSATEQPS